MIPSRTIGLHLIMERLTADDDSVIAEYIQNCDDENEAAPKEWVTVQVANCLDIHIVPIGTEEEYEIRLVSSRLGGRYGTEKLGIVEYRYVAPMVKTALIAERD
jgi:hypothetical protein